MLDVHFWPTPNGKKVTILLEELGLDYKIVPCNIGRGDQFKPDFLKINPNHRMPALVDHMPRGGGAPIGIFRIGCDHDVPRGKGRPFLPAGRTWKIRSYSVGHLANGQSGAKARRMRAFSPRRHRGRRPDLRHPPLYPTRRTGSTGS